MTTRQELLQALAEAGEQRPEWQLGQLINVVAIAAAAFRHTKDLREYDATNATDAQLLEGLRKLLE